MLQRKYRGLLMATCVTGLFTGLIAGPVRAADAPADPAKAGAARGSVVEDQAARKLLEAGDARADADEIKKAVEIWQSVIERYPRSKVRFAAQIRLGNYYLNKERAYDQARGHFEAVAVVENSDEPQRAEATLKIGQCFYEARNSGKCFAIMREVIEKFPTSPQVNEAYYYIGLSHFQLGHYSRAVESLQKVGTALSAEEKGVEKVEAGKRLYIRIEDADLAVLEAHESVKVHVKTTQGDEEDVEAVPVGRNVRVVLGSIPTSLGKPKKGNGQLEVRGDDKVEVTYMDRHTADRKFDVPRVRLVQVVGNAVTQITDGAYRESLQGVVLGKEAAFQVTDADMDLTDGADKVNAVVEVWREKTQEEIEAEIADLVAKGKITAVNDPKTGKPDISAILSSTDDDAAKVDKYKKIDSAPITLTEVKVPRPAAMKIKPADAKPAADAKTPDAKAADAKPADTKPADAKPADAKPAADAKADPKAPAPKPIEGKAEDKPPVIEMEPDDGTFHTGVFRATLMVVKDEKAVAGDNVLQALPNDVIRLVYEDKLNLSNDPRTVKAEARAVEGNLGGVRVTRADISDDELRLRTELRTAAALTAIGNHYKEFGLKTNAQAKYDEALRVCEQVVEEAHRLGGRVLEETYVQLWRVYFEMDNLELAAAMCQRLQNEFPQSAFVDEAMLQLAGVARKSGQLDRAIGLYNRLVDIKTSKLRGEAQYGVAECYEDLAAKAGPGQGAQLFERAFLEYKRVFEQFPDSGRVGEAVSKMANFYYEKKDYARAIDVFETVLTEQSDAKYLDVILFNYGRCLYRMDRKKEARAKFDQLIGEFPESTLTIEAKRISEALAKAGF
jgi:TolA-binding protein